jgi:hypothetical protein
MIEVVTFRVVGDEAVFLALDQQIQTEFAYQQPGLTRRTTARSDDGEWIVITVWASLPAAVLADAIWQIHPLRSEFARLTATKTLTEKRYESLP